MSVHSFDAMKAMKRMMCGAVLSATLFTGTVARASSLTISAEITRPENNLMPVTVTVINSNGHTVWSRTSRAARSTIRLPGDDRYVITFAQPWCIPKSIVVDVRSGGVERRKPRKVAFEVVLELDRSGDQGYMGPVGSITFGEGGGMVVRKENDLVRVR